MPNKQLIKESSARSNLKEMVQRRVDSLEKELAELKTARESLNDQIAADEELVDLKDKADEARRAYNIHKETLLNEPQPRALREKIKDINASLKELKSLLSSELIAYFMDEEKLEIEDSTGRLLRILINAKVKPTNQLSLV